MKKYMLALSLVLCFTVYVSAGMIIQQFTSSDETTVGLMTGDDETLYWGAALTHGGRWTATEGGTVKRIRVKFGADVGYTNVKAVIYIGTVKQGEAAISPVANTEVNSSDFSGVTFSTTDVVYYTVTCQETGDGMTTRRLGSGGAGNNWYDAHYDPSPASWSQTANKDTMFQMVYTPD